MSNQPPIHPPSRPIPKPKRFLNGQQRRQESAFHGNSLRKSPTTSSPPALFSPPLKSPNPHISQKVRRQHRKAETNCRHHNPNRILYSYLESYAFRHLLDNRFYNAIDSKQKPPAMRPIPQKSSSHASHDYQKTTFTRFACQQLIENV